MPYIGNTVQTQGFTPAIDYFSGNGVTVTFTLTRPVVSVAQMIVVIDNVPQNPSSSYTVSGSSITFSSAPLAGTNNIWVEYTSLITTYAAISQSPSVIGDITASGGYLAVGNFGNTFVDGTVVDYVTGNGRITTGPADGLTIYNGGTGARSSLLALNASGAIGVGTSPSYGTSGQFLTSSGTGSAPAWVTLQYTASYLIVAGGGAGGGTGGGGGGAGGYLTGTTTFTAGTNYAFVIGSGGAGVGTNTVGNNGNSSTGLGLTAIGGGGGGSRFTTTSGSSGGSGGGGAYNSGAGGSGTSGQGNAGGSGNGSNGAGAGGGGAGAAGTNVTTPQGASGGVGLASSITGSSVYYAGGGGGGTDTAPAGSGGNGGGGAGGSGGSATSGTANTGGGGGGNNSATSGSGGSGVVIISVPTANYTGTTTGSPTVTTSGSNTIIKFTSSGSYTA